jgi:predicted metal-dependent hydrolase
VPFQKLFICIAGLLNELIAMISSLHDPELGLIVFKTHPRSTRISIRLVTDGIKVTLPSETFYSKALTLIEEHRAKILDHRKKNTSNKHYLIDESHPLKTHTFTVQVVAADRPQLFFHLAGETLTIEYPGQRDVNSPAVQNPIHKGIIYFLRQDAKKVLPQKTSEWSLKSGLKYKSIKIQASTTRWGSCSSVNNINLSLFLLLLPEHLIDYVIVHELCHTVEHNHSEHFWAKVGQILPEYKALRNELKHHPISSWV